MIYCAESTPTATFLGARHVTLSYFTLRRLLCLGTRIVLVDVHASRQGRTIFDGDARCIDVTHNGGRFLQLSVIEAVQVSFYSALHHDVTSLQVGADTSLRPDSKATVELDITFKFAVQIEAPTSGDVTLDHDRLPDRSE